MFLFFHFSGALKNFRYIVKPLIFVGRFGFGHSGPRKIGKQTVRPEVSYDLSRMVGKRKSCELSYQELSTMTKVSFKPCAGKLMFFFRWFSLILSGWRKWLGRKSERSQCVSSCNWHLVALLPFSHYFFSLLLPFEEEWLWFYWL